MSLSDVNNMPLAERMHLMEQLWDSFKYEAKDVAPPAWHKDVLDKRKERYGNRELKLISLDELKQSYK
ncbi:MAG: addiction module protein [Sulfurovum sp.]|nr:addiction module protein [Sulfurovum sp.]